MCVPVFMGVDRVDRGHVPPFSEVGDVMCFVPPTFGQKIFVMRKFTILLPLLRKRDIRLCHLLPHQLPVSED